MTKPTKAMVAITISQGETIDPATVDARKLHRDARSRNPSVSPRKGWTVLKGWPFEFLGAESSCCAPARQSGGHSHRSSTRELAAHRAPLPRRNELSRVHARSCGAGSLLGADVAQGVFPVLTTIVIQCAWPPCPLSASTNSPSVPSSHFFVSCRFSVTLGRWPTPSSSS